MIKKFRNNVRMPKTAGWLIPGLEIKRWFALIFVGSVFIILGILALSNPEQVYHFLLDIKNSLNVDLVAAISILLGSGKAFLLNVNIFFILLIIFTNHLKFSSSSLK